MDFTQEQIDDITKYGKLLMTIKEIAILLGFDTDEFSLLYANEKSILYKTYTKAVLETKVALREDIIDMAILGSPGAQEMADRFLIDQKIDNE